MATPASRALLLGVDSLPRRYRWARFDAPELSSRVAVRHVDRARALVHAETATLHGPAGAGKTVLACCLFYAWLESRGGSGLFTYAATVAKEHHRPEAEARTLRAAFDADVLVLDGVGNEPTATVDSIVSELVHERHLEERVTILTTDLDRASVLRRYGESTAFRMFAAAVDLGD